MIKGFRQIALLTALSRVFGFVRDICYSHFFGAGALLDAWTIAFRIPNLSRRLFGEGAAAASFIPVYSEQLHKDPAQAKQLANTVVTVVFVLLALIVLLGQLFIWGYRGLFEPTSETKMVLGLTSIMLPYMIMVCTVAILAGILQVNRHFATPAAAPLILNIFIIASILITGWAFNIEPKKQLSCIAITVLAAGLVQIAMQIPPMRACGVLVRPEWKVHSQAFRQIVMMMLPMILGLTVTQINTLFDDLIAWWFSGSVEKGASFVLLGKTIFYPLQRGSVSHLYFAQRLYQLPLGVFGISLATAIFPIMSRRAAKNDINGLAQTVSQGLCSTVLIAIPATIGLAAVSKPLIAVAFEHGRFDSSDTLAVVWTLFFYSIGLCGFFSQQVLTRAFYAMQDSRTPVKSAMIAVFINAILNLVLIWFLGTGGLAAATAICAYVQIIILAVALQKNLSDKQANISIFSGLRICTIKTITATAIMSAVLAVTWQISKDWTDISRLVLMVPAAAITYLIAGKLMHTKEISLLFKSKSPDS